VPKVADFRSVAFDITRVDAAGKDVGRNVYWKLYAIENLVRVVVQSVLSAMLGPNWWNIAVDPAIRKKISERMKDYEKVPWHSTPGKHELYYALLSDLNRLIAANSHIFKQQYIPDIDQWVARIEQVRMPRNVVGHMNWLTATDRKRIDVFYDDIQKLIVGLRNAGLVLNYP
jgi:hypothetical protein